MRISKVVNNNMVSVATDEGEMLFRGPGIGFNKRPGDKLDESKIEQRFVIEGASATRRFNELTIEIPTELIEVCLDVVARIKEESEHPLNDSIYIMLTDHVANLVERLEAGIKFDNSLFWDLTTLYPHEYALAKAATKTLQERLPTIAIDDSEASFITLHIVNAELEGDMNRTFRFTRYMEDVRDIVASNLDVEVTHDDYNSHRLLVHLKYLFGRIERRELDDIPLDDSLAAEIGEEHPEEQMVVNKIAQYVKLTMDYELTEDEKLYLLVHIVQIYRKHLKELGGASAPQIA